MKIEHLNYFLETVSSRSINQASKKLFLNHQYLGQILDNIEDELGAQLLKRSRTGIELTSLGKIALPLISEIVNNYESLQSLVHDTTEKNREKIILNVFMTANLEPVNLLNAIDEMHTQFQNIDIIMRECEKNEIIKRVTESSQAIGQLALFDDELSEFQSAQNKLKLVILKKWPAVALVHRDSPLIKQYKSISLKTLLNYDIVLYAPFSSDQLPAYNLLKKTAANNEPIIKCITSNLHIFHNMMQKDNSVTLGVNRECYLDTQDLVAIPLRDNVTITSVLLIKEKEFENPVIQQFINLCKKSYV